MDLDYYTLTASVAAMFVLIWAFAVAFLTMEARHGRYKVNVNLLCAAGVVLAIVAMLASRGWTLTHGDVGMSRGMELFFAFVSLLALISPLAGLGQLVLLISELSWAASTESTIIGAAFPIALLSTGIVLVSMAAPLGIGMGPLRTPLKERLLTVVVLRHR